MNDKSLDREVLESLVGFVKANWAYLAGVAVLVAMCV